MSKPSTNTPTRISADRNELLARLVSFDTTSHLTNLPLIDFVRSFLAGHGIKCQLFHDETGKKASLHALIGPAIDGGIGLSGHTDVVPVTGQTWSHDAFDMIEKDGRLYGRGTTDMKGFLACVLASVPHFSQCALKRPIQILFSYDEEIGCLGVRPMIARMGVDFPTPGAVIVGEPTNMSVVDAHKGPGRWIISITGRSAHSSMPALGVNAIECASLILNELQSLGADLKRNERNERFEPPYSTLQVTTINGGSASNIVPATCEIGFGVRALPGFDIANVEKRLKTFFAQTCLPEMRERAPAADISMTLENHVPPFKAPEPSAAVSLALGARGQNDTFAVSYATEAGLFDEAGAPAVVCGPGDIAQAHTSDEWVTNEQLDTCTSFLHTLAQRACE